MCVRWEARGDLHLVQGDFPHLLVDLVGNVEALERAVRAIGGIRTSSSCCEVGSRSRAQQSGFALLKEEQKVPVAVPFVPIEVLCDHFDEIGMSSHLNPCWEVAGRYLIEVDEVLLEEIEQIEHARAPHIQELYSVHYSLTETCLVELPVLS